MDFCDCAAHLPFDIPALIALESIAFVRWYSCSRFPSTASLNWATLDRKYAWTCFFHAWPAVQQSWTPSVNLHYASWLAHGLCVAETGGEFI
jgi:hypothetical protein